MIGAISGGMKLVKVLAIIGLAVYVVQFIYSAGQDNRDKHWEPKYADLNKRYDKVHTDMSILNADVMAEQAGTRSSLAMFGKDSEVQNVRIQAEVDFRVERYLTQLALGRMRGDGDTDSLHAGPGTTYSLSRFAKALSDSCAGKLELYRNLSEADERITREILLPYDQSRADNKVCRDYTQRVDAEIQVLKKQLEQNLNKIEESQVLLDQ